jgi:ATP-dependent Zn protease
MFIVGLLGLLILAPLLADQPVPERSYTQFRLDVAAGRVQSVRMSGNALVADYQGAEQFRVALPGNDPSLESLMLAHAVTIDYAPVSDFSWWSVGLSVLFPVLVLGSIVWLMQGQGSGGGAGQVFRVLAGRPDPVQELLASEARARSPSTMSRLNSCSRTTACQATNASRPASETSRARTAVRFMAALW